MGLTARSTNQNHNYTIPLRINTPLVTTKKTIFSLPTSKQVRQRSKDERTNSTKKFWCNLHALHCPAHLLVVVVHSGSIKISRA